MSQQPPPVPWAAGPWRRPMRPRDENEEHRTATALELLFDLSFVVAIAQAAAGLAHDVVAARVSEGLLDYLLVFFAIWWAWMNFTWFASAYDTDDVPYRLLTMLQMSGVLVLAAGVPRAFESEDFGVVVAGYFVMRVAMVAQWLRAARSDPYRRATALKYAAGIGALQVLWLGRLGLPDDLRLVSFLLLAVGEMVVPYVAEGRTMTPWHPHHIAERYGLLTIIVLGESVFATTVAVEKGIDTDGVGSDLLVVAVSGLVLLFGAWWLYFMEPSGDGLANRRGWSFVFGYGHYGVFAALAALGAGLEVAVEAAIHHVSAPHLLVAYAVAAPVVAYLLVLLAIFAPVTGDVLPPALLAPSASVVAVLPLATVWWSPSVVVALVAAAVAGLVAVAVARQHRVATIGG